MAFQSVVFRFFLPCLTACVFNCVHAQSGCRHSLIFKGLRVESTRWSADSSEIVRYEKNGYDSIVVHHNAHVTGSFLSRGGQIISPRFIRTAANDRLLAIDSFAPPGTVYNYPHKYFDYFYAPLYSRREYYPNGMPAMLRYNDRNGADSLELRWRPNGILEKREQNGIVYTYSATGILQVQRSKNGWERSIDYHPSGTIKALSFDTLVKNQAVTCVLDYSPQGTLLKESWFKDGKPCATWREYNRYGALLKTIHYQPLQQLPEVPAVSEAMAGEAFMYAQETAAYAGGETGLSQFMKRELGLISCDLQESLDGTYVYILEIDVEGKALYRSVSGKNSAALIPPLKKLTAAMPKWNVAKVNGKRAVQAFVLELEVRNR